jgi:hypothetical protein
MLESKPELQTSTEPDVRQYWVSPVDLIPGLRTNGLELSKDAKKLGAIASTNIDELERKVGVYAHTTTLETPYASRVTSVLRNLEEDDKEAFERIKNKFKGKPLVDLGAGGSALGFQIAVMLGASAYIGVEPYNTFRLADTLDYEIHDARGKHLLVREKMKFHTPPFTVVSEDSLKFLKRLPDKSVNILSSGTDNNILPNEEYAVMNAKEIARVLDSAALFYDSVFEVLEKEEGFKNELLEGKRHFLHAVPQVISREM